MSKPGPKGNPIPRKLLEKLYAKEKSIFRVAMRVGRSADTVRRYLHAYGIKVQPRAVRKIADFPDSYFLARLRAGVTITALAVELDVGRTYLTRFLGARGLSVRELRKKMKEQ